MSKQHISSAGTSRKFSKSSHLKSSASHHLNPDLQHPARIRLSGCLNSAADKRGKWCDISPFVEDISLNNRHKLNGYVKNNLDDNILGRMTLLNLDKKLKSAAGSDLHEHQMGKIKHDEFVITEEISTDKDNEIQKLKMIQHLQDELFDCQSTVQLLKSEHAENTKELQSKVDSMKEKLAQEIGKRSNLENSQAALMKLMEEMEKLLQSERDKVCDLMSNCTNLKQDSNHWETVFKQEQQFRQELEQKYFAFLDRSRIERENDNCLLLTEAEKLRLQYSDLIEQLNRMKTVAEEQQETEKKLAKENEQLRCTVDSLNGILSKHVEKTSSDLECNSSDSFELREQLKSAVQDSHLYQQRCNQLQYKIDDLKKELQEKLSELTRLESSSNQNICELSNNLKDKEMEFEKHIREKDIIIEKIEHSVQELMKEKSSFMAQLHGMSLELEGKKSSCRLLQQENQILSSNFDDLKIQLKCQDYIEKSLNDMTEQRTKLSYENGLLTCRLEKLQLELERMPAILSELQQLKKNALEIDARNVKLQTDLVARETLVHQLESELKSMKTLLEQLYSDLNATDAARDKFTAEKQQLTDEVTRLRNGQMKTVEDLQSALAASREDTSNVSAMLERVVKSHTNLQATVESVEAEKAKQDSLLEELTKKNEVLSSVRESLESDLAAAEARLRSCRDFESAELATVKRELSSLRDDNKRLLTSTDKLLNSNEKCKSEIEQLQNEVSKKSELLKTLKEEREIRDGLYSKQKKNLEDKVEFLNSQLIQEQNDAAKKFEAEKREMNFLFDQLMKKNNEINDENTRLQCKNKELQFRLKEESQKTESLLKTSRDRIAEMEKNNDECMRKNEAQSLTIQKFMSVVLELQSEMKSLEQVKLSGVDGQQSNELCKVQNAQKLKLSYEDEMERAVWKEMKRLVQELKESRGLDFKPRHKSKHGINKALKSVERATALVEASCKTIGHTTTDERSFSNGIDLEKKMLQQQLENERNKATSLEIKLRQIQESSLRHTEALARELDIVKSSAKLFLGDK